MQHLEISLQLSPGPVTPSCPFSFFLPFFFSWRIRSCIDLDFEPRVFESISDRNAGSLNPRLLIFRWISGELFAVNMKHYPPSSGIPRGESYRVLKGRSAVRNGCSGVLSECFCCQMGTCSLVSGLVSVLHSLSPGFCGSMNAAEAPPRLFIANWLWTS